MSDERHSHHRVVLFDLWCQGRRWSDWFRTDELVLANQANDLDGRPS